MADDYGSGSGGTKLEHEAPKQLHDMANKYNETVIRMFNDSLKEGNKDAKGVVISGKLSLGEDGQFHGDASVLVNTGWYETAADRNLEKIKKQSMAASDLIAGVEDLKEKERKGIKDPVVMPGGTEQLTRNKDGTISLEPKKDFTHHLNPFSSPFEASPGRGTWEMLLRDMQHDRETGLLRNPGGTPITEYAQGPAASEHTPPGREAGFGRNS